MRVVDMSRHRVVWRGLPWPSDAPPPSTRDMLSRLERNEALISWLQPLAVNELRDEEARLQAQFPAIQIGADFYTISLRMMKAVWRHVRLRKGFVNREMVPHVGVRLRIPTLLLSEKIRTQQRFNVMRTKNRPPGGGAAAAAKARPRSETNPKKKKKVRRQANSDKAMGTAAGVEALPPPMAAMTSSPMDSSGAAAAQEEGGDDDEEEDALLVERMVDGQDSDDDDEDDGVDVGVSRSEGPNGADPNNDGVMGMGSALPPERNADEPGAMHGTGSFKDMYWVVNRWIIGNQRRRPLMVIGDRIGEGGSGHALDAVDGAVLVPRGGGMEEEEEQGGGDRGHGMLLLTATAAPTTTTTTATTTTSTNTGTTTPSAEPLLLPPSGDLTVFRLQEHEIFENLLLQMRSECPGLCAVPALDLARRIAAASAP